MSLDYATLSGLAAGNTPVAISSASPATAVIVQNGGGNQSPVICDVAPTQSVNLNQLNVSSCSTQTIRMTFTNTTPETRTLIFGGNMESTTIFDLHPELGIANSPFTVGAITSNTAFPTLNTNFGLGARFNSTTVTGIGITRFTSRFASDQPWSSAQSENGITLFTYPIDINTSILKRFDYSPFCDACYNSNTNNKSTLQFDLGAGAPLNFRMGILYNLQGLASVTLEFEIGYGSMPNTQIVPTSQFFV